MHPVNRPFVLLPLILVALLTAPDRAFSSNPPNIVIILVDDLGYGDPGCYNPNSKIATPNIDRLAREGMLFTDAHSAGVLCHPSRYGLITGQHPFRIDVSKWPTHPLIEPEQPTIASILSQRGYRTEMIGKWHLGFKEDGYDRQLPGGPIDRGFENFFGLRASTDIPPYFYIRGNRAVEQPTSTVPASGSKTGSPIQGAFWRAGGIAPSLKLEDVLPKLTSEAVKSIHTHAESGRGKPFFLYFAPTGPHTPWLPSKDYEGKSPAGSYGDFTMMVDDMIGRLLAALDETKLSDNTLVIFTSDNGPVWYPEDTEKTGHDSVGGLRGMKGSNWEGGHRIPFVVRWPGKVRPSSISHRLLCFTDVIATIAEATGEVLSSDAGPDSYSFLPSLLGTPTSDRTMRETLVIDRSIRWGKWKWIEGREPMLFMRPELGTIPTEESPAGQLYNLLVYNLLEDPTESNNLAISNLEMVEKLRSEWIRIRKLAKTRP